MNKRAFLTAAMIGMLAVAGPAFAATTAVSAQPLLPATPQASVSAPAAVPAGAAVSNGADGAGGLELASDTCFARGEALAVQRGATLVGAELAQEGGRAVCRIVLLVQGGSGERPRREVVVVPR
ncbi:MULTISPECIES: hypothetical protein [unclassified Roseitalea]|uniref:hypothetical protein n=1 Tax=unclassified Roseitalea TaxID=2639107 RepID=UPI00273DA805|nr:MULTISPECIES: hypothetical protein [unclassified Roseitalea]